MQKLTSNGKVLTPRGYLNKYELDGLVIVNSYSIKFTEHCEYFPYGEVWVTEKKGDVDLPFKFTSKELDSETNLYYYGARYMDPRLGRFVSVDPPMVKEAISRCRLLMIRRKKNDDLPGMGGVFNFVNLNVYHYAANNPIRFTDPNGNWAILDDAIFTGCGIAVGVASQGFLMC